MSHKKLKEETNSYDLQCKVYYLLTQYAACYQTQNQEITADMNQVDNAHTDGCL